MCSHRPAQSGNTTDDQTHREAALAAGKGGADPRDRQVEELKREVSRRDQVIGELTIANRLLKKSSDGLL